METFTGFLNDELESRGIDVVRPVIRPDREFPQVLVEWVGIRPAPAARGEFRSTCRITVAVGYVLDDETNVHEETEEYATTVWNALVSIPGVLATTPPGPSYSLTDPRLMDDGSQLMYRAIRFEVVQRGSFQ